MEWRTNVTDAMSRPREVVVSDSPGRVTVAPPPGEGFSLDPDQCDLLILALLAANNRARKSTQPRFR